MYGCVGEEGKEKKHVRRGGGKRREAEPPLYCWAEEEVEEVEEEGAPPSPTPMAWVHLMKAVQEALCAALSAFWWAAEQ